MASGGERTHEHARVQRVPDHAHAVAEQCSPAEGRRRVDGEHGDLPAALAEVTDQPIGQRRLARTRRPCHPDDVGTAAARVHAAPDLGGRLATAFDDGQQSWERRAVAGEDRVGERPGVAGAGHGGVQARRTSAPSAPSLAAMSSYPRSMWWAPITDVSPSATSPAMTSAAPARMSGAFTGAPDRRCTPRTTAWCDANVMSAPMRWSSATYA